MPFEKAGTIGHKWLRFCNIQQVGTFRLHETPKITVLMPVYNGERFLRMAIDSVLSQDFKNFELMIVDDGSTDGTVDIVLSYPDPRIRLFLNPRNLGIVGALQAGLQAAQGEYIARLDADDRCYPGRFRLQAEYLDDHPRIMVLGSACDLIDDAGVVVGSFYGPTEPILIDWELLLNNAVKHSSVMFRRAEILEMGGYQPGFPHAEDYDLWRRVSNARPASIAQLKTPLIQLRIHCSQLTAIHRTTMVATADGIARTNIERLLGRTVDLQALSCLTGHAPGPCGEALIEAAHTILSDCWHHFVAQRATTRAQTRRLFSAMLPHLIRMARQDESLRFRALFWAWRGARRYVPEQLFTVEFLWLAVRIAIPKYLRPWQRFKSECGNFY